MPFTERPTFKHISNLFTCFAECLSYEITDSPYNHAHLIFNYRHQLLIDIKEIELRQYRKTTTHNDGPLQDVRVPIQDLPAQHPVPPGNAQTQNNTQVTVMDVSHTHSTTDTSSLSLAVLSAGP